MGGETRCTLRLQRFPRRIPNKRNCLQVHRSHLKMSKEQDRTSAGVMGIIFTAYRTRQFKYRLLSSSTKAKTDTGQVADATGVDY